jgi:cell wall assembly regulator SMI1
VLSPNLFTEFNLNPPADPDGLEAAEEALGVTLPPDYRAFLLTSGDGGDGFVGAHYVQFWRAAELFENNDGYGVLEYAPELLGFGSDGDGEMLAFDMRRPPFAVRLCPFIGMGLDEAHVIANSFTDLLPRMKLDPDCFFPNVPIGR